MLQCTSVVSRVSWHVQEFRGHGFLGSVSPKFHNTRPSVGDKIGLRPSHVQNAYVLLRLP